MAVARANSGGCPVTNKSEDDDWKDGLKRSRHSTRSGLDTIMKKRWKLVQDIEKIFVKHTPTEEVNREWSDARRKLAVIVDSMATELGMAFLMMTNLVLSIVIVDTEASGQDVPAWMRVFMTLLTGVYCVEVGLRMFVFRWQFFVHPQDLFDVVIVSADLASCVSELIFGGTLLPEFAPLRIVRVIRLLRSAKILILFRSLYLLICGVAGAMRAVIWALVMISFALVMCSIFAVVVLQPYVDDLVATTDVFDGCGRCATAYTSVWRAYVTFFQHIVAGDSWGSLAIPIMDAHPWTALFFIPVLLFIQLGLINTILAVVVDKAQEARESNKALKLELKEQELMEAKDALESICAHMDTDGSGALTLDELLAGYDSNLKFQELVKLMDLGKDDMKCIFSILDSDHSGTCTYVEFVNSLWKMKSQDSHTLLVFIKSYVMEIKHRLDIQERANDLFDEPCNGKVMATPPLVGRNDTQREEPGHVWASSSSAHLHDVSQLPAFFRNVSQQIEQRLDTLSLMLDAFPSSASAPSRARSTMTVVDRQQDGQPAQPHRGLSAAFCFASESAVVTKANAPQRSRAVVSRDPRLSTGSTRHGRGTSPERY